MGPEGFDPTDEAIPEKGSSPSSVADACADSNAPAIGRDSHVLRTRFATRAAAARRSALLPIALLGLVLALPLLLAADPRTPVGFEDVDREAPRAPVNADPAREPKARAPRFPPAPPLPPAAQRSSLAPLLDAALADAKARGIPLDTIAARVVLPDGSVLGYRDRAPMIPASTLKIVTAAAALDLLGADHTLATELWIDGVVCEGVLEGSLVVVGHGDPAPSSRAFPDDPVAELRPWVEALRARGISRITGGIIGDDRFLAGEGRRAEWPADQRDRWYCAPSGALNLNDNCVDVVLSSLGGTPRITLRPATALFEVDGSGLVATTREKDHLFHVGRASGSWQITVRGKFLGGLRERVAWITVPDPTRAFLGAFEALLEEEGITVEGVLRSGARSVSAERVARIEHSVASTLPVLLKNSQNLYGDALLRVTDRTAGGDGSFESAGRTLARYATRSIGGAAITALDGSGLARQNRIDCETLVQVLRRADAAPWSQTFWDAMPVAAVDGTLSKRFRRSPLAGRLRGKTGTLSGVTGLVGGWDTAHGPVRFAALAGGRGVKIGPFKRWLESWLGEIDAALAAVDAPTPVVPGGGSAAGEGADAHERSDRR